MQKDLEDQKRILLEEDRKRLIELLEAERLTSPLKSRRTRQVVLDEGAVLTREIMGEIETEDLRRCEIRPSRAEKLQEIRRIEDRTKKRIEILKKLNEDKIAREAAMAVGETSGQAGPRKVVSSGGPRDAVPAAETQPLIREADPELEKLLDEEEAIAKRTAQGEAHETPHFRGED